MLRGPSLDYLAKSSLILAWTAYQSSRYDRWDSMKRHPAYPRTVRG